MRLLRKPQPAFDTKLHRKAPTAPFSWVRCRSAPTHTILTPAYRPVLQLVHLPMATGDPRHTEPSNRGRPTSLLWLYASDLQRD